MSGLSAAHHLRDRGWDVLILEKSRGPGGRMATRRIAAARLDHGAQHFAVRDPRFASLVSAWESAGLVQPWFTAAGLTRYRAAGGMNTVAKHYASQLEILAPSRVGKIELTGPAWQVVTDTGASFSASALLLTPPAPQSFALLAPLAGHLPPSFAATLNSIEYDRCLALLALLDGPSSVPAPGFIRPGDTVISWLADNSMKGVTARPGALTLHATPEFSLGHWNEPDELCAAQMLTAASPWLGSSVLQWQLHRWRFSRPTATQPAPCLFTSGPAPLAIAGDAFAGPRIEGAFLSGLAAASALAAAHT
jgi:renalase